LILAQNQRWRRA